MEDIGIVKLLLGIIAGSLFVIIFWLAALHGKISGEIERRRKQ